MKTQKKLLLILGLLILFSSIALNIYFIVREQRTPKQKLYSLTNPIKLKFKCTDILISGRTDIAPGGQKLYEIKTDDGLVGYLITQAVLYPHKDYTFNNLFSDVPNMYRDLSIRLIAPIPDDWEASWNKEK